jgi:16S rRNA (adenine1518-N6/adenine1519-N6)-dimethyltransferase
MIPVRKRWGQHFLVSPATAERIADAARLDAEDTVIEVGPGDGALTRPLLARAGRVLAIEIDPMRADALALALAADTHSARLAAGDRVRVVTGDALAKPFGEWLAETGWKGPAVLAANLPYNVATPILLAAIEEPSAISRVVATVQKEVAQRFAARAGSAAYGYLSVRAAAFAVARVLFDIPPGAFRPRPKVVSSVLELVPRAQALDPGLRDRAVALASLGFRQRRKTLANALAPAGPRAAWEEALEELGKDRRVRAEELSLDDFLALARMPRADAPARISAGV